MNSLGVGDMERFLRGLQINLDPSDEPPPDTGPECSVCKGAEWYTVDGKLTPCVCQKEKHEERLRTSRLGQAREIQEFSGDPEVKLLRNFTLAEEHQRTAHDAVTAFVQQYLRGGDRWLYLYGSVGNGKTHLASSLYRIFQRRGIPVVFISSARLVAYVRQGMTRLPSPDERVGILIAMDVLVLDDLGAHTSTVWADDRIHEILQGRYERRNITVMTSNLPIESCFAGGTEHQDMQAQRTIDRMREMCDVVTMNGTSYRSKRRGDADEG